MIGDTEDMASRLAAIVPRNWFSDASTYFQAVLEGIGAAWSAVFSLIGAVQLQTRILTATDMFLDLAATDFFGMELARRPAESDTGYRVRFLAELLRPRATRAALAQTLVDVTGRPPVIFEPGRTTDTGGYGLGGAGYGVAGGWGNLELPYQIFVTAFRPAGGGIAELSGYGTGGVVVYGNLSLVGSLVTDADIFVAITRVLPAATTAWARIT